MPSLPTIFQTRLPPFPVTPCKTEPNLQHTSVSQREAGGTTVQPALPEARPIAAVTPRPRQHWGDTNTCTRKGVAPSKRFQLLGSFEAPNQEFKLGKVQLAAGIAFRNGKPLASVSYNKDNRISCLAPQAGRCEREDYCVRRTRVCLFLSDFGLYGA